MNTSTQDELRADFEAVASTIAGALSEGSLRVVGLVAKWEKRDLVPGLSDIDFRIICDDDTTADDWIAVDRLAGGIQLEMSRAHPEWNRINEHTAGAGMTVSEVLDGRFHNPEYSVWSLWWGRRDWFDRLKNQTSARKFDALDEQYHLSRFLYYYSPYIHGIDPPINLGAFEPKYALHSRCWHYFAPPILSAASLLARRNFSGKWEGLTWLRDNGCVAQQVDAVFRQVDTHYETPERTDPDRLQAFEDLLFSGFEQLFPLLTRSLEHLDVDRSADPPELKRQLASNVSDPIATLVEYVRYARIRAGRYDFYVNAPEHFDVGRLFYYELNWIKKLTDPIVTSLRTLLGDRTLSPEQCFGRLGLKIERTQRRALDHVWDLASRARDDVAVPELFEQAIDLFPHYYLLIEEALSRVAAQPQPNQGRNFIPSVTDGDPSV